MFDIFNFLFKHDNRKGDEEKIKNLTDELSQIKSDNWKLWKQVKELECKEKDFQTILIDYDKLLEKAIKDADQITKDKKKIENNYSELLNSYNTLNKNYERAKNVINVLEKNEILLRKQVTDLEKILSKKPRPEQNECGDLEKEYCDLVP